MLVNYTKLLIIFNVPDWIIAKTKRRKEKEARGKFFLFLLFFVFFFGGWGVARQFHTSRHKREGTNNELNASAMLQSMAGNRWAV